MNVETRDYTPQEDKTFIYTISVTETKVGTGLITSDADEETTKEILLESLREGNDSVEFVEFRLATEEELELFAELYSDEDKTIN